MNKIPTLFARDDSRRYVLADREHVTPGCEWVLAGEGTPTRKYDGTCMLLDGDGAWWARREVKPGKTPPAGYIALGTDAATGKTVGWEPAAASPFAKFLAEAVDLAEAQARRVEPGTYELIGPRINGNPEGSATHQLIAHARAQPVRQLFDAGVGDGSGDPVTLVRFLGRKYGWEGVVWHHPDGRMAKLKARDLAPRGEAAA